MCFLKINPLKGVEGNFYLLSVLIALYQTIPLYEKKVFN